MDKYFKNRSKKQDLKNYDFYQRIFTWRNRYYCIR